MKILDAFKEFLILGYEETKIFPDEVIDREIDENMVLRVINKKFVLYYITSGTKVEIPIEYIKMFSQFGLHSGNKIAECKKLGCENNLEEFILSFTYLSKSLLEMRDKDRFTACLEKILTIGTVEFNDWVDKMYNITFPPIEFISINLIKSI